MPRNQPRPEAASELRLEPIDNHCPICEGKLWVAYHNARTVATLSGLVRLRLVVRWCVNRDCELYHERRRPEQEGAFALPQGEFGLDVIALVGALRHVHHRSVPEIHRELLGRGLTVSERTVTNLLDRYEELVALRLSERTGLRERLKEQGQALLSMDGLQPDVGHEVLWVVRECLWGEVLLARSLLGGTEKDLVALLREVADALPVPITGVVSDGQRAIRKAVGSARYHERRASGRRNASPAMVVRGSVRVVAAVATPPEGLTATDIRPVDVQRWRTLRASLEKRRESRRAQLRFRRDPDAYLGRLEEQLLKQALPS
jgi:hypothetical protein